MIQDQTLDDPEYAYHSEIPLLIVSEILVISAMILTIALSPLFIILYLLRLLMRKLGKWLLIIICAIFAIVCLREIARDYDKPVEKFNKDGSYRWR